MSYKYQLSHENSDDKLASKAINKAGRANQTSIDLALDF